MYESCNGHDIILLVYPPIRTWKVSATLQVQTDGECHAKSIKPMDSRTKALQQCAERRSGNCGVQESHQHVRPLLLFPQLRFKREKGNAWYAAIVVPDPRWIFVERPHAMPWQLASAFRTPRNFASNTGTDLLQSAHLVASNHVYSYSRVSAIFFVQPFGNPQSGGTRTKSFIGVAVSRMQSLRSGIYIWIPRRHFLLQNRCNVREDAHSLVAKTRTEREPTMQPSTTTLLPHKLAILESRFPAFLPRWNTRPHTFDLPLHQASDLHDAQSRLRSSLVCRLLPLSALRP